MAKETKGVLEFGGFRLDAANALLAGTDKSLKDLQTALDTENPHADKALVLTNTTAKGLPYPVGS